jgi:hypothetical protein
MVYTTQQVSLRSILFVPLPLTSIHDIHDAWRSLGSSLVAIYRQLELPLGSSIIIVVTLYLAGVATIHITTPALLRLQFHNVTTLQNITVLGPFNYTSQASGILPIDTVITVQRLNFTGAPGLHGNMFYEVPDSTSSVRVSSGHANVSALRFNPKCRPLGEGKEDLKLTLDNDFSAPTIDFDLYGMLDKPSDVLSLLPQACTPWGGYQSSQPMFMW